MIQPRRWWPGLIGIGVLWLVVIASQTGRVERDLARRAEAALPGLPLDGASVAVNGRDAILSGHRFDEAGQRSVLAAVDGIGGIRLVKDATQPLPPAKPYAWSATRDAASLTLDGNVPRPDARAALASAAATVGKDVAVRDAMTYAAGAPDGFAASTGFALAQLARLNAGKATLQDGTLSLTGEAPSSAAYEAVLAAVAKPPAGLTMGPVAIAPPLAKPFVWQVDRQGDTLATSGSVPDPQTRAALVAALRQAVPSATIQDSLSYARGAPPAFGDATALATKAIGHLASGKAVLSDGTLALSGTAASPDDYAALAAALADAKGSFGAGLAGLQPPTVSPYVWQVKRDAGGLELSGSVASPDLRDSLVEAARKVVPGGAVKDGMTYGAGAPASFPAATAFAFDTLATLSEGQVSIADERVGVAGVVGTSADYARLAETPLALPPPLERGDVALRPPLVTPYGFSAEKAGSTLRLAGAVPSPAAKGELMAAAKKLFPGATVADALVYGQGEPKGYGADVGRALAVLAPLADGRVAVGGGVIEVSGTAATSKAYETALARLADPPAATAIRDNGLQPPRAATWEWSVQRQPDRLVFEGLVPSPRARAALVAAASEAPGTPVEDRLSYASGAPDGFETLSTEAVRQAVQLSSGRIALRGETITIEGRAADATQRDAILAALAAVAPAGMTVQPAVEVPSSPPAPQPPPAPQSPPAPQPAPRAASFSVHKDGAAGTLVLSGHVASEDDRAAIVAAARRKFFGTTVDDKLTVSGSAPDGFREAVVAGLGQLARLDSGSLSFDDGQFQIEGKALYGKALDEIKAALAGGLPKGFTWAGTLDVQKAQEPLDAAACQQAFVAALSRGSILFETGKATIDADSTALLDALVATAMRCPASHFTVGGHTDSSGSAEGNLELSRRRADAVRGYLERGGIPAGNLEAKGFGSSQPVASNDTDEGKARNRRIEISVN